MAVEHNFESRENVGIYTEIFTETITNINSDNWTAIPEFPTIALLHIILVAIPIVLVAYKKKGNPNSKLNLMINH